MPLQVFVTGGTGFVGREVVRQLKAAGHVPHLLCRKLPATPDQACKYIEGDVLNTASLEQGAYGKDAIIHLVGIISQVGQATFANLHTGATRNVLRAAQTGGVRRFVHMSALGTRPNAASRYHTTKWDAEELVRSSGLEYTIFRPSLIYGPEDHFVNLFAKVIRMSPLVPLIGRRDALLQPVHVRFVANAFVQALATPASIGKHFDLCGNERFTLRQIVEQMLRVMGRRRVLIPVPRLVAKLQASFLEAIFPIFRQAPPLNRDQLIMLDEDNVGDCRGAGALFPCKTPEFSEGIREYLRLK